MITGSGGWDNIAHNLQKLIAKTKDVNPKVLMEIGMHLESEASQKAPIDKGDLRASSTTEQTGPATVRVAFTERYALVMHEDMNYRPQEPGTGPKYLTGPLRANERKYMQKIVDAHRVR